jgi:thiol-disulfide isomerase/thioredoxin
MKKFNLTILVLAFSLIAYSQTIIKNPATGLTTAGNVTITEIVISDSTTVLSFHTKFKPANWIEIPKETYIQTGEGGEKLFIVATEGIPLGEKFTMPESGEVDYKLIFPKIDASTATLDYGEGNDGGSWFIYDIQLKAMKSYAALSEDISGSWFNSESGDWEIGFFDTLAVYKKQIWSYGSLNLKKGNGTIELRNNSSILQLHVKKGKNDAYMIGESPKSMKNFTRNDKWMTSVKPVDDKPYELPLFKLDTAIYSGYIKGYTPRHGGKTGLVAVNDIITGEQSSFLFTISENGYFLVKVPMYYPHEVFVRSDFYNGSVILEPGKELFQMIQPGKGKRFNYFMGELARLNSEWIKLNQSNSVYLAKRNEIQDKVLELSPAEYKAYCKELSQKEKDKLEQDIVKLNLSAKAQQIRKIEIEYEFATKMLSYNMEFQSAYRIKNKIPDTVRTLAVKPKALPFGFYDFLNNEMVNNPIAVLSNEYHYFLSYIRFIDGLYTSAKELNFAEIAMELEKTGYVLSDKEKEFIKVNKDYADYMATFEYKDQATEFYKKYNDNIKELVTEKKLEHISVAAIEEYLLEKGISLSEKEKVLIEELKIKDSAEASVRMRKFTKENPTAFSDFFNDHRTFTTNYLTEQRRKTMEENLEKHMNIKVGFATDILKSREISRSIVSELTPLSDAQLQEFQKKITTPFIAEYVSLCNEQAKTEIEANKNNKGSIFNEAPTTEGDKVFEEIMKKYLGKVVYVDFWATWCGPCRSGIERIKPLKEEMADQDIVFVYITNPSSPKQTYENMIPGIKGEHYRLSQDEWNYISAKFKISGIPHIALIGKKGEIINPHLSYMSNEQLKKLLEKHIME